MSNSKQPEYDMAKVQGLFVGYQKFAVDREWLRQQEEQRYRDRQLDLMNGPENGSL